MKSPRDTVTPYPAIATGNPAPVPASVPAPMQPSVSLPALSTAYQPPINPPSITADHLEAAAAQRHSGPSPSTGLVGRTHVAVHPADRRAAILVARLHPLPPALLHASHGPADRPNNGCPGCPGTIASFYAAQSRDSLADARPRVPTRTFSPHCLVHYCLSMHTVSTPKRG